MISEFNKLSNNLGWINKDTCMGLCMYNLLLYFVFINFLVE